MGIFDLNFNPFKSTDDSGDFFSGLWTGRSEKAYKDFLGGGWKKPKEWINPGGVMANPAQQIADPGNFFTKEEHENWLKGDVSDRTKMSALVAGAAYGGGALMSAYGGGGGGLSNAEMGNLLAKEGIGGAGTVGGGSTGSISGGLGETSLGSSLLSKVTSMDTSKLGSMGGTAEPQRQAPSIPNIISIPEKIKKLKKRPRTLSLSNIQRSLPSPKKSNPNELTNLSDAIKGITKKTDQNKDIVNLMSLMNNTQTYRKPQGTNPFVSKQNPLGLTPGQGL